jgi:cytochrome o ubiquinol oxidase operon protein cyoD
MSKPETSSTTSYVIGFVLSLLLTVSAYFLVVSKTVAGSTLLAAIIGLAVVQILVQVFFFLHLGRGPKPLYNLVFFVATAGIILVVIGGSIFIMDHLHYNMTPADTSKQLAEIEGISQVEGVKTGACQQIKKNHHIIIVPGGLSPVHIDAQLCDTLSFTNHDSVTRTINFGRAAKPTSYAGQADQTMRKGLSQTITLNQSGSYTFYDQQYPNLIGSFTVAAQ